MKEENGKILGVIGGMGPLATQLFYRMVIESTDAKKDQDHINMIILNHATMPDRTAAIMDGTIDKVLDKLAADAKYLEDGGATCIAIPYNTTHAPGPRRHPDHQHGSFDCRIYQRIAFLFQEHKNPL